MSVNYGNTSNSYFDIFSSFILIVIIFVSIYFYPCGALNNNDYFLRTDYLLPKLKSPRLFKRDSFRRCANNSECETEMLGSVCVDRKCICPQGFLPNERGMFGCLRFGKALGSHCNVSKQCGIELDCRNNVCLCREGFQLFHSHGTNMCLLWHKPTRIIERCRLNEDCVQQDINAVCKKRWCQCGNGYQMFETMLFGWKQKCFKTFPFSCHNSSQCSRFSEMPDQYCMCYHGVCHCMVDVNSTSLNIPERPNSMTYSYQHWKKDLIRVILLLLLTVILFFGPCLIYITLGERSRQFFYQFVQPSRTAAVHYTRRRSRYSRPLRSYRGIADIAPAVSSPVETHHVQVSLHPNGINSHLIENHPRLANLPDSTEEDPPPSYEEIMCSEIPPPPYREL